MGRIGQTFLIVKNMMELNAGKT